MPDANIKLPGIGPVKKQYVYLAVGGTVILAGITYYRRKKAATNTPATSSTNIDPATGFAYGSPEDAAALAANAQSAAVSGGFQPTGSTFSTAPTPQGGFTSNPQWAQAAETYLVDQTNADPNVVGNALGKYTTGGVVTDAQDSIIEQAIAFEGYPPVPGPDGYPPSIRRAPPTPTPPPPSPTPAGPKPLNTPQLFVVSKNRLSARLRITPVPNAAFYALLGDRPPINVGQNLNPQVTAGHAYHVRAYPSNYSRTTYTAVSSGPYSVSAASPDVRV